ncbi:hypothetical protein Dimus_021692 [Dionaea muscipula]
MTNCLQLAMPTWSIASSSVNTSRRYSAWTSRSVKCRGRRFGGAKIPMPPLNPNDPFIRKIAHVAENDPDTLLNSASDPETPPFLDLFESPKLMSRRPPRLARPKSINRMDAPDLASFMLLQRVVFIGLPLVSAVTELVNASLLYLNYMDPKAPIHLYISSSGTTRGDGETVARECEGFATYDLLMNLDMKIYTVNVALAVGLACLLLASGTKGKRYMFPSAQAMIQQPRLPPTGLVQASDLFIHTKEAVVYRTHLEELLALHTGNPVETVAKKMKRSFYMNAYRAQKFGVIDHIYWVGNKGAKESYLRRWEEHDE